MQKNFGIVSMALILATAAVSPVHGAPSSGVQAGIRAWSAGDGAKAVAIWRPLAIGGNADAMFNLGQAYKLGRGVTIDLAEAQRWYLRAANAGHRDAQTSLGLTLFANGDRTGALKWLGTAADAGEPRAMLVFGTALFNGEGVAMNRVRAYALVSRAAAAGLADAKATLGEMDQIMPLADRQLGVALAMKSEDSKPVAPVKTAVAKPAPGKAAPAKVVSVAITPPVSGGWRVQLGAFAQRSAAEALFRRLAASGALAGRQPIYTAVGAVTRLQAGPYSTRAAASATCAGLSGQACFPVKG